MVGFPRGAQIVRVPGWRGSDSGRAQSLAAPSASSRAILRLSFPAGLRRFHVNHAKASMNEPENSPQARSGSTFAIPPCGSGPGEGRLGDLANCAPDRWHDRCARCDAGGGRWSRRWFGPSGRLPPLGVGVGEEGADESPAASASYQDKPLVSKALRITTCSGEGDIILPLRPLAHPARVAARLTGRALAQHLLQSSATPLTSL